MKDKGRLDGKVAIVTGAAQGIGAAYAEALARAGADVCVADILDPSPVVEAIVGAGGRAVGCVSDVTDLDACKEMVARTVETFGGVDVMVANAAIFAVLERKGFEHIDGAEWDRVMAVNVKGVWHCACASAPEMRKRGSGSIINIASDTVMSGVPGMLHYVSSKGAVIAMTRALARELGDDRIRVNAIAPGLTMSEGMEANRTALTANIRVNMSGRALKRDQLPGDLTGTLLFLASDESAFMTGQTLVVDGGLVTH